MADSSELIRYNSTLDSALLFIRDVLELAASARAKMRAAGLYTLRRRSQDFHHFGNDVCRMLLTYFNDDTLSCNAIGSQDDLAIVTSPNSFTLMARALKLKRKSLRRPPGSGRFAASRRKAAVFLSAGFHSLGIRVAATQRGGQGRGGDVELSTVC